MATVKHLYLIILQAILVNNIKSNYLYFDGYVVLMRTDTMTYTATAPRFKLENLGKPVIFTG